MNFPRIIILCTSFFKNSQEFSIPTGIFWLNNRSTQIFRYVESCSISCSTARWPIRSGRNCNNSYNSSVCSNVWNNIWSFFMAPELSSGVTSVHPCFCHSHFGLWHRSHAKFRRSGRGSKSIDGKIVVHTRWAVNNQFFEMWFVSVPRLRKTSTRTGGQTWPGWSFCGRNSQKVSLKMHEPQLDRVQRLENFFEPFAIAVEIYAHHISDRRSRLYRE